MEIKDCEKCGGDGWLHQYELDSPGEYDSSDNHYSCDFCCGDGLVYDLEGVNNPKIVYYARQQDSYDKIKKMLERNVSWQDIANHLNEDFNNYGDGSIWWFEDLLKEFYEKESIVNGIIEKREMERKQKTKEDAILEVAWRFYGRDLNLLLAEIQKMIEKEKSSETAILT